jgi:hypothetical protein
VRLEELSSRQVWWCTFVISLVGRLRKEGEELELEARLSYRVRPYLKKKN